MSYLTGPSKAPNPHTTDLLSAIDRTIEKALIREIQNLANLTIDDIHIETKDSWVTDCHVDLDLSVYIRTLEGQTVFCGAKVGFNFIEALIWENMPNGAVWSLWTEGGPKRLGHMLGQGKLAVMTGETFGSGWIDVRDSGDLTLTALVGLSEQEYITFKDNHPSTYTYDFGDGAESEIEVEHVYYNRNHAEMEPPARVYVHIPVPQTFSLDTPWKDIVDQLSPHLSNILTPGFLNGAKED